MESVHILEGTELHSTQLELDLNRREMLRKYLVQLILSSPSMCLIRYAMVM